MERNEDNREERGVTGEAGGQVGNRDYIFVQVR